MIKRTKQKLTLDQPTTYCIKEPGVPDKHWSDWDREMTVAVESCDNSPPATTLTGSLDQTALQGLLRRLYSLGMPLISVICIES